MSEYLNVAQHARQCCKELACASGERKNKFLLELASSIDSSKDEILRANQADVASSNSQGASPAFIDRLTLTGDRVKNLAQSVRDLATLGDPVGTLLDSHQRPNGLTIRKVSVPIGSILIVYESRPNVTIDAACLCIKSGNSVILKGGKEAVNSNRLFCKLMQSALQRAGLPDMAVQLVECDRQDLSQLLRLDRLIDLVIPRGSEQLVEAVSRDTRIPVLKNSKGVCHIFVDESADIESAIDIADNAKTQRPGVCNAMETLLIHRKIAGDFLPPFAERMRQKGVELRADPETRTFVKNCVAATEADWDEEYGALVLALKIVGSLDEALSHIASHGTGHSEAILTQNEKNKVRFLNEVDAAAVYANASTRFTDGGEFGMGAEIGISTGKFHARGPMGLKELNTYKYLIEGSGQVRK